MVKILWASRHSLDPEALTALKGLFVSDDKVEIVQREILWPADREKCADLACSLADEFYALTGIWPAQAVEALGEIIPEVIVYSPVSVPETEPDVKKTRPFRFVRWARIV